MEKPTIFEYTTWIILNTFRSKAKKGTIYIITNKFTNVLYRFVKEDKYWMCLDYTDLNYYKK